MRLSKTIITFILSSILFTATFSKANAEKLLAAIADWTGGEISCQVAVSILEDELGYEIDRIVFASGTGLWEAIAAGDIDFACESWPSYAEADEVMLNGDLIHGGEVKMTYSGDGSVKLLGTVGITGMSDYYVPKYWADANPDFSGVADLNNYKSDFATMESGDKGRLIGCPVAGWNCHDQKRLDLLGLDFVADELGTETAALAEAQGMYDRGEPFLMYLWEPHWFFGVNDLVGVKLAPNQTCDTFTEANNWETCGADYWPATGWAVDYPMNYGNPETFAKPENQLALEFFGKMALSNADQAAMLVQVREGAELNDVVAEWKANNKSTWEKWLPTSVEGLTGS